MNKIYIYKRTNLINNKVYIGQTINNPEIRWKAEDTSQQAIGVAVRTYGSENFLNEIIDYASSREELNEKEKYWISYYDSNNKEKGYNRTKGGSGGVPSTYRKIIIWKSMELAFPTEKSIINFLYENQNIYTISQIARFIRIGLRTKKFTFNYNGEDILLDLYTMSDYDGEKSVQDFCWQNCYKMLKFCNKLVSIE